MDIKPKCIIVTGRAGSGKTTLSKRLGQRLWMPVLSRDEIKEGYVNTFGVKHDQLPPETDRLVTDFFFDVACRFLAGKVSVIIEAAFQHPVWEWRMPDILELSRPFIIVCSVDAETAAQRHLKRGLENPRREFYHEDKRVSLYRATGDIGTPQPYASPNFDVPTLQVLTENDYSPSLSKIALQIESDETDVLDEGPFYHGTKADLQVGDFLTSGFRSNYKPEVIMNHIYFTALPNGAGLAPELAQGEGGGRVYIVEPTGSFENDPNVTDKKFPGNPTRSYRSQSPLKIVGEVTDWVRLTPEELREWREKMANIKGEIIN